MKLHHLRRIYLDLKMVLCFKTSLKSFNIFIPWRYVRCAALEEGSYGVYPVRLIDNMHLSDFDYPLPEGLIAQFPAKVRDQSRLMVLHRGSREIEDKRFYELRELLNKGDLLVINDTRVFPARLIGKRKTGGRVEIFLLESLNGDICWKVLIRSSKKLRPGEEIFFDSGLRALIKEEDGKRAWTAEFSGHSKGFWETLEETGKPPLPPYIKRSENNTSLEHNDKERYQTVFAKDRGAVAAPTAGLHFTRDLLSDLIEKGIEVLSITLHIGWGTFKPVRVEDIREHTMHPEYYKIKPDVADSIMEAKRKGLRVIAVGTSVVRALEYALVGHRPVTEKGGLKGYTDLFILPGFKFNVVDAMITNFHLPESTLLMLVSAFAGKDNIMDAYKMAISRGYRFYSYGDAMLIL